MRIVALDAVGCREWLILVSLLQIRIFGVMTIQAQRRSRFGQVEFVLFRRLGARFVRHVAGVATRDERGMAATLFRHMQTCLMATQAEIFFLVARRRFQKLVLVGAAVRVVARQAITNRRRMHGALDIGGFFIRMTSDAQRRG